MKKLIIAAATAISTFCGALTADTSRVVVVSHGQPQDPFWSVVKNGVDEAAKEANVKVEYRSPDSFDMVKMAQIIDAAIATKPDGLVVSIPDKDALAESIKKAVNNGIPVISMNSGADTYKQLGVKLHVGQSEYLAGKGAGERMRQNGVKKGLCVNHEQGNAGLDQRCDGFVEGMGGNAAILAVSTDPTEVRNALLAYLNKNRDVEGILTLGPIGADPTIAAIEQAGAAGKVKIGTFDLSPAILKAIKKGSMDFAIDQQQYLQGYLPVIFLSQYTKYGVLPNGEVQTGPGFVTQENAGQVVELSKKGIR
ncbi:sugar ABC transporter substrate-binding protein [Endozoicomonas sp. SM1973]|uniref:Sugar ABC transporter substrate-binding protein n=1 Tax=Spartinivicinus marinus TaxID=2994442 RepID=A0A853IDK5_9GAMM|nr:sugar ABC transporter substrate-binding protein [Spartinivicinus marinus]MCX4025949.1 sugar ABC transporter substrate-binding protein [Spartinivicinus marinus]NYZ68134.1 sugar ABC transporter substrate-binding protein [Spartinivicinus marinus]